MADEQARGIDHVGLVVQDLAATADRFRALGFTLTQRADHTRPGPDGRPVPAGSSQQSVMLRQGYLEIMAITDPAAGHMLTGAADRYEGVHILALATADAARTHDALQARGVLAETPQVWRREIDEGGVQRTAEFCFFGMPRDETPEAYVIVTEQRTPEMIRPPASLDHANTAEALQAVAVSASDPDGTVARYERYTGVRAKRDDSAIWSIDLAGQTISILRSAPFGRELPATGTIGGLTIGVRDLDAARAILRRSGEHLLDEPDFVTVFFFDQPHLDITFVA